MLLLLPFIKWFFLGSDFAVIPNAGECHCSARHQPHMANRHGKYSWSKLRCAAGWNNTVFQRHEGGKKCKIFLMSLLEKWNYICSSHLLLLDSTSCCCCLVTKSCPTLHDPVACSTPGFPALLYLPGFAQTHVHLVGDAVQPSHPLSAPSPPAFNLSQHQGLF